MKTFSTLLVTLWIGTFALIAQVPSPQSTNKTFSGAHWVKTSDVDYELKDKNGRKLTNVKDLLYLSTDTLSVLDKSNRTIYLLHDFKNAATGSQGGASILASDVKKNFYITNPNSFGFFKNDTYVTGPFCNINGSYVYYLSDTNATYYLDGIRGFSNWGAKSATTLPYSKDNVYWYRDAANGKYGVIDKGETIDYDRVTSTKDGNDLIVKWDGNPKYVLEGYYTMASFVYKPVKMYAGASTSSSSSSSDSNCVRGDCQNGWGKYQYDGGHYDGFWKNGKKNGYGLYKWEGTGKYIGNWVNDKMSGYGVYIADNNDNIIGEYKNGQLNGLGIQVIGDKWEQGIYSDGNLVTPYTFYTNKVETGCTAGDCQNKYGRFKWDNGDSYTGFWKNGNMHMGTYTFASGGKYTGMFNSDNQFHGTGRYFFEDDAYYGGEWRDGKYHGLGYYHNKDLEQQIGEWTNGSLTRKMK